MPSQGIGGSQRGPAARGAASRRALAGGEPDEFRYRCEDCAAIVQSNSADMAAEVGWRCPRCAVERLT